MTHNDVSTEEESYGSQEAVLHQIDITSLDAAGQENYQPSTELNIPNGSKLGVVPVGQNETAYQYHWDTDGQHLNVINSSDGGDAANNAATGEVRLLVVGGGL